MWVWGEGPRVQRLAFGMGNGGAGGGQGVWETEELMRGSGVKERDGKHRS